MTLKETRSGSNWHTAYLKTRCPVLVSSPSLPRPFVHHLGRREHHEAEPKHCHGSRCIPVPLPGDVLFPQVGGTCSFESLPWHGSVIQHLKLRKETSAVKVDGLTGRSASQDLNIERKKKKKTNKGEGPEDAFIIFEHLLISFDGQGYKLNRRTQVALSPQGEASPAALQDLQKKELMSPSLRQMATAPQPSPCTPTCEAKGERMPKSLRHFKI